MAGKINHGVGLLLGLKGQLAEGKGAGLRCVLLGLGHSSGRNHHSWKEVAGMVCARGGPGILVGESAWAFGTCPFCWMVPTEQAWDDESYPFLLDAQLHQLAPIECHQGPPASHRQCRYLM